MGTRVGNYRGRLMVAALVGWLLLLPQLWGQETAAATMVLGNRLYEEGNYEAAVQTYQQLVDQGRRHPAQLYNLGNAYYRSGDLGRASLNYERADRLAPRDADVRANLTLARSQTIDQFGADVTAVDRLTLFARSWLTTDEMALLTWLLWLVLALLLTYRLLRSEPRRLWLTAAVSLTAALWVGGLFSMGSRIYVDVLRPDAVIVAAEVDVYSAPDTQETAVFTLHSGASVTIVQARRDWMRIALPGGELRGWLPETAVAAVAD